MGSFFEYISGYFVEGKKPFNYNIVASFPLFHYKKKEREANPAPLFLLSNLIFFDTHRMGFLFVSILLLLKKKNKPSGRALFAISSR